MCLQTYLYYYCKTLLFALKEYGMAASIQYGLSCVSSLCERWEHFYAPVFLNESVKEQLKPNSKSPATVLRIHRVIQTLRERCDSAARAKQSGDLFAIRCEYTMLECILSEIVIPELKEAGYHSDANARVAYFDATDSFLASFSPLSGTECFDGIPGVYNDAEELAIMVYFDIVRRAPTVCYLSGVAPGEKATVMLVDTKMFKDKKDEMCGLVHFEFPSLSRTGLCKYIYDQWL